MRVLMRADGGPAIGWGHLSRCAALAAALSRRGAEVRWACRYDAHLSNFIGASPDHVIPGAPSFDRLPFSEVEHMTTGTASYDWIVIDHYGADADYLQEVRRRTGARVLLMDDHQVRAGADLRLAPMQARAEDTLFGPRYLLMRACFDPQLHPTPERRSGLLICFGGADHAQDTRGALLALERASRLPSEVTVLASDVLAERQGLDSVIERLGPVVKRRSWIEGAELAARFASVGAALVSSSVLAFEALAMGAPIVAVERVDNQRYHAETLRRLGVPAVQEIEEAVRLVLREQAVALPTGQIDALGAVRVASLMTDDGG